MLQSLTINSTKARPVLLLKNQCTLVVYSLINRVDHANEKCLFAQIFIKTINFHSFFYLFLYQSQFFRAGDLLFVIK